MDAEDHLRIYIRVRPPKNFDLKWTVSGSEVRSTLGNDRYCADEVFHQTDTNEHVFDKVGKELVESTVAGYNTALCAYGQSGSGKTHTLLGSAGEDGAVYHLLRHLFNTIETEKENESRTFLVQMQVMELYCEKLRDLLKNGSIGQDPIIVEENNLPQVHHVQEESITSAEQAIRLIEKAQDNRVTAETALNERSSRSHAIIQLTVESSLSVAGASKLKTRRSVMSIVDLAGSENAALATGIRLREGNLINQSLFHLTKVINMLTEKNPPKYIPYRDSKLTRLLKPALGGNSKTAMICCMDPENQEETARTLKFSERVKMVKSCATVNEAEEEGKLGHFLAEIDRLKEEMKAMKEKEAAKEKQDRLSLLNAQLISGGQHGNAAALADAVAPRANRRMTWAPGALMRSIQRQGSLSPARKKNRANLDAIDETEDSTRISDSLLSDVSRAAPFEDIQKRPISFSRRPNSLGNEDANELESLRFKNLEMEMKIRSMEQEKAELVEGHGKAVGELNKEIRELVDKSTTLELKLRGSEDNLKFFENRLASTETDLDLIKEDLTTANNSRDLAEQQLEQYKVTAVNEMAGLDRCNKALKEENKALEERLSLGEMSAKEKERLVRHGETLAAEISSLKNEMSKLKHDRDETLEEKKQLIKRNLAQYKEVEEAKTILGLEKKQAAEKLTEAQSRLTQAEANWNERERSLQQEVDRLKEEFSLTTDEALAKRDAEICVLREKLSSVESTLQATQVELGETRARVISEVQESVMERMKRDEDELCQLRNSLASAEARNKELIEACENSRSDEASEELRTRIEELTAALAEKEDQMAHQAAKQEAEVRQLEIQKKELANNIGNLKRELDCKKASHEMFTNRLTQYRSEINEAEQKTKEAKKEAKQTATMLAQEQLNTARVTKERDTATAALGEERKGWETERAALKKGDEEAQAAILSLRKKVLVLETDSARLQRQLSEATEREKDGFKEQSDAFSLRISELEEEARAMSQQKEEGLGRIKQLENELSTQKMIATRALKETQLMKTLAEQTDSDQKDRELAQLRNQLQETRRQLADAEENTRVMSEDKKKTGNAERERELVAQLEEARRREAETERAEMGRKEKEKELSKTRKELEEMKKRLTAVEEERKQLCKEKEIGLSKYSNVKEENARMRKEIARLGGQAKAT